MQTICQEIVKLLKQSNKTISFMESCTGGYLANAITNISGASDVLKISLVTYSNEYKIKFGVNKNTIDTYTVYSAETAKEMAKNITEFANSNIGIGITGELGNTINKEPKIYYSIYLADKEEYTNKIVTVNSKQRNNMKEEVAINVFKDILNIIN